MTHRRNIEKFVQNFRKRWINFEIIFSYYSKKLGSFWKFQKLSDGLMKFREHFDKSVI